MSTLYQDMIGIIENAKNEVVAPSVIETKLSKNSDKLKAKLHKKYNECYGMMFNDSKIKDYIKNIGDYLATEDDSVSSFSDYLNLFHIKNVSRFQEAKKNLKANLNNVSKERDNYVKKSRGSLNETYSKILDDMIDKSDDSINELSSFCDKASVDSGLSTMVKKMSSVAKKELAEKGLYTTKTLSNAVYNEGKGTGMVGALKNASNVLMNDNATTEDIDASYKLLSSQHPKGFKNGYAKFATMAASIAGKSKKTKHDEELGKFKELIKECDSWISDSVNNLKNIGNDIATKMNNANVVESDILSGKGSSITENIADKGLKLACDSMLKTLDMIKKKVKDNISKSNQEVCTKLLSDFYTSSCSVALSNDTGFGGMGAKKVFKIILRIIGAIIGFIPFLIGLFVKIVLGWIPVLGKVIKFFADIFMLPFTISVGLIDPVEEIAKVKEEVERERRIQAINRAYGLE